MSSCTLRGVCCVQGDMDGHAERGGDCGRRVMGKPERGWGRWSIVRLHSMRRYYPFAISELVSSSTYFVLLLLVLVCCLATISCELL